MSDQVMLDQTLSADGKTVTVTLSAGKYSLVTSGGYGGGTLVPLWSPSGTNPEFGPVPPMPFVPAPGIDVTTIGTGPGAEVFEMGSGDFHGDLAGATTPTLRVVLMRHVGL